GTEIEIFFFFLLASVYAGRIKSLPTPKHGHSRRSPPIPCLPEQPRNRRPRSLHRPRPDHNKKESALLEFAGTLHHLTIEAIDARKLYEAKVWMKPWMVFKEVQEFKHAAVSCVELRYA
ncbi:unnamed protein product, partial [Prunus brigantina]